MTSLNKYVILYLDLTVLSLGFDFTSANGFPLTVPLMLAGDKGRLPTGRGIVNSMSISRHVSTSHCHDRAST